MAVFVSNFKTKNHVIKKNRSAHNYSTAYDHHYRVCKSTVQFQLRNFTYCQFFSYRRYGFIRWSLFYKTMEGIQLSIANLVPFRFCFATNCFQTLWQWRFIIWRMVLGIQCFCTNDLCRKMAFEESKCRQVPSLHLCMCNDSLA